MTEKGKIGAVVSGLIISLLLMILSMGILPAVPVSAGNTVGMVIEPTPKIVTVNDTFSVDIKVTISSSEAVNTAEAHIDFNPAYLEVVSITAGSALPTPLQSTFNNTLGTIDYGAGAALEGTPPAPTADFILATLNLKAKAVTAAMPLTFVFDPPLRETQAYVGLVGSLNHSAVIDGSVIIDAAAASRLEVTGNVTMTAGGSNELTITAKDQYGDVATSYNGTKSLTFSGPGNAPDGQPTVGGINIGSATAVNFVNGVSAAGAATLVAYKVEATTVDVTDGSINSSGYGLALTVNAAAASQLGVVGITDPVVAGTNSGVTVTARDAYGNTATNYTGTIRFTSSDAQATLPGNYTFLLTDLGVKMFGGDAVTMKTAGEQSVTATDTVTATITGQQTGITVTAAAVASQLVVSGITDPVAAGTASNVTVTVKDAYGNIITSYTGTIRFTSSDAQATLPGNYTFLLTDHGVKTFSNGVTLKTPGEQSVTATDTVSSVFGQQTAITVTTAAAYSLVVSGITDPVAAGTTCSVTVTVKDAYGNTVTNYTGKIHFTSLDTQATLPADYTFVAGDNGVKTLSGVILKTAGEQWVRAMDTVTATITGEQTGITVTGEAPGEGGTNWGAIIGGIIGGLLVIGIIVYLLWRRKRT